MKPITHLMPRVPPGSRPLSIRVAALSLAAIGAMAGSRMASATETIMMQQTNCQNPAEEAAQHRPIVDRRSHERLSKVLEQRIDVPVERFASWFYSAPLESMLKGTKDLPGVVATEPMTELSFPQVGARRLVCLSDGNSAIEEVLHDDSERYFAYLVWGYTIPQGRGNEYGYGEFWFEPDGGSTLVRWRYSFKLKGDRFPGYLGPVGRALFRAAFLDRSYERFMRSSLQTIAEEAVVSTQ